MHRIRQSILAGIVIVWVLLTGAALASEKGQTEDKQPAIAPQKTPSAKSAQPYTTSMTCPVYKPPLRGSPAGRIGGGTRGATERETFSLMVLAPDHIGLTIKEQPDLYWFISKPIPYPVELTVIERNAVKPLIEKDIHGPDKAGVQTVRLADYGVVIKKGVPYKWFVTIVADPEHRSKDILAGGVISLVNPPEGLDAKLKAAGSAQAAWIYAEEGLWYDALEALSALIEKAPDNLDLRQERAALLEQVGLTEVATFERNR